MSKRLRTFLILLLAFALPVSAQAQVSEFMLENGLKVIIAEDHKAPLAVFQIWYKVGSMDEAPGRTGMSHLLEHMMFKGTEKYGSKEISRQVQRLGGVDNAYTSKDVTVYFQRLPSDKISLSVDIESDRMQNLLIEEQEVLSERKVVMEERRLRYEDDPQNSLYEEVVAAAFKAHPYQWPVIGWMADLAVMQRDTLKEHYQTYYAPNNAFIVVVGDVDPKEMFSLIKKRFSAIKPGAEIKRFITKEPTQRGQRRVYLKKEAELPYILAVYHTPKFPHKDAYALEVLASVLSDGKSSRLYKSLIYEKKVALSAFAEFSGDNRDPHLFYFGATAAPGVDAGELEDALWNEAAIVMQEPPTDFELQKAKNQIEAYFIMGQDSLDFQARVIGTFEMMGDWRMKDAYVEGIREVTAKDVQRVAAQYLVTENRTTGVLIPIKHEEGGKP